MEKPKSTEMGVQTEASDDIVTLSDDEVFVMEEVMDRLEESPTEGIVEEAPVHNVAIRAQRFYEIPQPKILGGAVSTRSIVIKKPTLSHRSLPVVGISSSTKIHMPSFKINAMTKTPYLLPSNPLRPSSTTCDPAETATETAILAPTTMDRRKGGVTKEYFQKKTAKTDVIILLLDNGKQRELHFNSIFLMNYSKWFETRLPSPSTNKERWEIYTEYSTFYEAMACFHFKQIPEMNLFCDKNNGRVLTHEKRLLDLCRVVDQYQLRGALVRNSHVQLFESRCHLNQKENHCPTCIDRVAVALRFTYFEIPKRLRFSQSAVEQWVARKGTVAHQLNNFDAVVAYLKQTSAPPLR